MPNYLRKIELGTWKIETLTEDSKVPADAITRCLNTRGNTLSLWQYDGDNISDALLAVTSNFTTYESIDYVVISTEDIEKYKVKVRQSEGVTLFLDYKDKHYDICDLDYDSLGTVSEIIKKYLLANKKERLSKAKITKLLAQGVIDGKISIEELKVSGRKKDAIIKAIGEMQDN